jgi:hypothetical protein
MTQPIFIKQGFSRARLYQCIFSEMVTLAVLCIADGGKVKLDYVKDIFLAHAISG